MNKHEFSMQLRERLAGLPRTEIEGRVAFYREMIDDRMEEGMSEEDAVRAVGTLDDIVANEVKPSFDVPLPEKPRKGWTTALLAIGSPVLGALLIAAAAVVISLYAALWSVIVSLWSVFASLIGGAVGGIASGFILVLTGHFLTGMALIGAALLCVGFDILTFYGCKAASRGAWQLTKKTGVWLKNGLTKKEAA